MRSGSGLDRTAIGSIVVDAVPNGLTPTAIR